MTICGLMKTTLLDFPGHVACTVFTGGCNFRCPFCHNAELLETGLPSEYSEEEILGFIKKRSHTLDGVAITGGEPTLQKDLPDFIRKIKDETGLPVKLDTNGINPEMVRRLIKEGLIDYVAMDIKAGPDRYPIAAGIPHETPAEKDSCIRIMEHITETKDLLLSGAVPYEFRTTVVGGLHEAADFEKIGPYIQGAAQYFLQSYKDSGNILDRKAGFTSPSIDDLKTYRELVRPFVKNVELRGVEIEL